jgi:anti-anti-sigma regulatory factor
MRIEFPETCTIEKARHMHEQLLEAVREEGEIRLNFENVQDVDLTFFQLLHAARKSCEALGISLVMEPSMPARFAAQARQTGLEAILLQT